MQSSFLVRRQPQRSVNVLTNLIATYGSFRLRRNFLDIDICQGSNLVIQTCHEYKCSKYDIARQVKFIRWYNLYPSSDYDTTGSPLSSTPALSFSNYFKSQISIKDGQMMYMATEIERPYPLGDHYVLRSRIRDDFAPVFRELSNLIKISSTS